ncbi:MAG: hypothetical protein AAF600_17250 [Bacteroidota bacterium]
MYDQPSLTARKSTFNEFINKLAILNSTKEYILHEDFFKRADFPNEYLYYPELFAKPFIKEQAINEILPINIAGYLYLRSIIILDRMMDKKELDPGELILLTQFQEMSLKILSETFIDKPQFWEKWNQRKSEYLQAAHLERTNTYLSFEVFEELADYKSAFGKVAIDSVYIYGNETQSSIYQNLLESHRLFSCGFQILDDIQDFKEDLQHKQPNLCFSSLSEELNIKEIESLSPDVLHKQIYVKGIVAHLLERGKQYLKEAKAVVKANSDELSSWTSMIDFKLNELKTFSLQLSGYEKVLISKKYLSHTKNPSTTAEECLNRSYAFVTNLQHSNGSWEDFCLNAGVSNVWVTAFVGYNLPLINEKSQPILRKAGNFLLENRQSFLWGYNKDWVPDGDSTTWALLFLERLNIDIQEEVDKWLFYQQEDGGFSTYRRNSNIQKAILAPYENVDGWINCHHCVSAAAYYFLSNFRRTCSEFKRLETFILDKLESSSLNAYWWTSPIYSQVYTLLGLQNSKSLPYYDYDFYIDQLLISQNENGSFGDTFIDGNVFYTSLALLFLTSNPSIYEKRKDAISQGFKWLIDNQMSDGSYDSSTCLRVPSSHITDPNAVSKWRIGSNNTNIVTTDHSRLFSTTIACRALFQFIGLCKGAKVEYQLVHGV